jgi:glycosyltransferase involved in cell wall biosynthesis
MKVGKHSRLRRRARVLSDIANWAEPAIAGYLRVASRLHSNNAVAHHHGSMPHDDVRAIHWPRQVTSELVSNWLEPIRQSLATKYEFVQSDIPQPYKDLLIFHIRSTKGLIKVAVDVTDYSSRVEPKCLEEVDAYFKLQFNNVGYGDDRIRPGGFVARSGKVYSYLPILRSWSLDQTKKRYDVYGRFGPWFGFETRSKAIGILKGQQRFQFAGDINRVPYARYLREAARARICIDLPGNGPFCFRLIEYLALGGCVVAYPHRTRLSAPLEDREHIIYCKEDMSDLVELCEEYLNNESERIRIGRNAAEFFDKYLSVDVLSEYYVRSAIDMKIGSGIHQSSDAS